MSHSFARLSMFRSTISIVRLLILAGGGPGYAQTADSTAITGVVLDPDAKAVVGAVVMARNEVSGALQTTATDSRGHFSVNVAEGTYTVEIAVPGFEIVTRNGLKPAPAASVQDVSIQLSIANISETVTVSVALRPPRSRLSQVRSPRGRRSHYRNEYIRNHVAGVGLQPVLQMAPGPQRERERPGTERYEDVLPRVQGRLLQHDLRRDPVQRHERSDAPLVGVLSGADDRFNRVRAQPRFGRVDRTVDLRRFGELPVAGDRSAADHRRHGVVRFVQHEAARPGVRLGKVRQRQDASDGRRTPDDVGRLPDVQLSGSEGVLGEVLVRHHRERAVDRAVIGRRSPRQHA